MHVYMRVLGVAECVVGTVGSFEEAEKWLRSTFLWTRMVSHTVFLSNLFWRLVVFLSGRWGC